MDKSFCCLVKKEVSKKQYQEYRKLAEENPIFYAYLRNGCGGLNSYTPGTFNIPALLNWYSKHPIKTNVPIATFYQKVQIKNTTPGTVVISLEANTFTMNIPTTQEAFYYYFDQSPGSYAGNNGQPLTITESGGNITVNDSEFTNIIYYNYYKIILGVWSQIGNKYFSLCNQACPLFNFVNTNNYNVISRSGFFNLTENYPEFVYLTIDNVDVNGNPAGITYVGTTLSVVFPLIHINYGNYPPVEFLLVIDNYVDPNFVSL